MAILQFFQPSSSQLLSLVSVLVLVFSFGCYGALVGGRGRFAAVDIFVGWGLVTGAITIIGVVSRVPFTWLFYGVLALGAASAIAVWRRDRVDGPAPGAFDLMWRIGVLSIPLLVLVACMKASQWDEFSQWLPNALYLFRYDGFPSSELPISPSTFPAYPHGGALTTYLISRLSGFFVENAGGLANTIMLLCFAPVYLSVLVRGLEPESGWNRKWGYAALGVLGVTALSTVFVQKLIFTAYADTPTAILLGVIGVLVWMILDDLAKGKPAPVTLAWQFSLVSALFINFKQTNPVLFFFLLAAAVLIALRDPDIRVKNFLKLLPIMLICPVVVYLAWRYHVGQHLVGREFSLLPYENWLVPQAFDILGRMLLVASKKGFYFVMMGLLSLYAIWSVFRYRGSFDRLAMLVGCLFIGYNVFLFVMYVIAFGAYEGPRAASFWRYNTQLGILGCTAAAYGVAILWRKFDVGQIVQKKSGGRPLLSGLAIVLVVVIPIVKAEALRFDVRPPKDHARMVGQYLAGALAAKSKVAVIDPRGQGLASLLVKYEMAMLPHPSKDLTVSWRYRVRGMSFEDLAQDVAKKKITHAWVHEVIPGVSAPFGLELAKYQSHLLKWTGTGWRLLKSWPYDGYQDPLSFPD
ncbi:MAG: hypothetical protein HN377_05635 [Alphaproteobacteria bacterium]|nr:hypothetical protein [Alphaproteobacteria bacterium]